MTNDDALLAGFLDRSLSEDQLLELEARKAASPEFAHQFSNMLTLETMLASATPKVAVPAHFLATVENAVAAKMLVGGASAGGLFSGLSSMWAWLGGAALVVVTAGSIYYFNQPQPVIVVTALPGVSKTATAAEPQSIPSLPLTPTAEATVNTRDAAPTKSADDSKSNDGNQVRQDNLKSDGGLDALAITVGEYNSYADENDQVKATITAFTLGTTYRSKGDLGRSEDYFAKAVMHARKAKLVKEEINALGEQAVTAASRGNETQARLLLNQAISRGSSTGIDVSVWTQKLKDLR